MRYKTTRIILFGLYLSVQILSAQAFWPFTKAKIQSKSFLISTFNNKSSAQESKDKIKIAFISKAFLYPVASPQEDWPEPPRSKISIAYRESQVLLQEAIKQILEYPDLDLVIFGGSLIADQKYFQLFEDISYELQKYGLASYRMLGYGETQGPKDPKELITQPFYLLEVSGVYILVIDNVSEKPVPDRLPEEASEQFFWLKQTLEELNHKAAELYILSYYPLDSRSLMLIQSYPQINIALMAYSAEDPSHRNSQFQITKAPFPSLRNAALSIYPCAFTVIERSSSQLEIKLIESNLRGVKDKAKQL